MFITYKGSQAAMHIEVGGRYFRLVPSQPVELTDAQAAKLQSRKLMQILVDAGELEFSERTKPIKPSAGQTDEGLQVETVAEPEPAINAVADDVVSDPMPELDNTSSTEPVTEKIEQLVSDMTVSELKAYITDNGGSYSSGDNKPELLVIAQDIENAKQ